MLQLAAITVGLRHQPDQPGVFLRQPVRNAGRRRFSGRPRLWFSLGFSLGFSSGFWGCSGAGGQGRPGGSRLEPGRQGREPDREAAEPAPEQGEQRRHGEVCGTPRPDRPAQPTHDAGEAVGKRGWKRSCEVKHHQHISHRTAAEVKCSNAQLWILCDSLFSDHSSPSAEGRLSVGGFRSAGRAALGAASAAVAVFPRRRTAQSRRTEKRLVKAVSRPGAPAVRARHSAQPEGAGDGPQVGAGGLVGFGCSLLPVAQCSERYLIPRPELLLRQAQCPANNSCARRLFHVCHALGRKRLGIGIGQDRGANLRLQ